MVIIVGTKYALLLVVETRSGSRARRRQDYRGARTAGSFASRPNIWENVPENTMQTPSRGSEMGALTVKSEEGRWRGGFEGLKVDGGGLSGCGWRMAEMEWRRVCAID